MLHQGHLISLINAKALTPTSMKNHSLRMLKSNFCRMTPPQDYILINILVLIHVKVGRRLLKKLMRISKITARKSNVLNCLPHLMEITIQVRLVHALILWSKIFRTWICVLTVLLNLPLRTISLFIRWKNIWSWMCNTKEQKLYTTSTTNAKITQFWVYRRKWKHITSWIWEGISKKTGW